MAYKGDLVTTVQRLQRRQRRQRRRRGRCLGQKKSEFIFYKRNSCASFQICSVRQWLKHVLELNMQWRWLVPNRIRKISCRRPSSVKRRRIFSFHVVVLLRTAKKCTKNFTVCAQQLFCSLNLRFCSRCRRRRGLLKLPAKSCRRRHHGVFFCEFDYNLMVFYLPAKFR